MMTPIKFADEGSWADHNAAEVDRSGDETMYPTRVENTI